MEPLIAPVLDFVCPSSWVSKPEWISRLHFFLWYMLLTEISILDYLVSFCKSTSESFFQNLSNLKLTKFDHETLNNGGLIQNC